MDGSSKVPAQYPSEPELPSTGGQFPVDPTIVVRATVDLVNGTINALKEYQICAQQEETNRAAIAAALRQNIKQIEADSAVKIHNMDLVFGQATTIIENAFAALKVAQMLQDSQTEQELLDLIRFVNQKAIDKF